MNEEGKECTFLWFIENYSYSVHENTRFLKSPDFTFDGLEGTTWNLLLYPKGCTKENRSNISLYLYRTEKDAGPAALTIEFELSFLAEDGSVLHSRNSERNVEKLQVNGFDQFVQTDEIHSRRKAEYLPDNTLTVRCKMWTGKSVFQNAEQISARTRIHTEEVSFLHVVKSFGSLKPNVKKTSIFLFNFPSGTVSGSIYYTDGSCGEEKIMFEIVPSDAEKILHKCKLFWLDNDRIIRYCGGIDYAFDAESVGIYKLPLNLTRETILNKGDEFSLLCECTFSTGIYYHTLEVRDELSLAGIKQESIQADEKDVCKVAEKIPEYTGALEDIKDIHINQRFADVVLKTKTKSFRAHRVILSARSPVFEAMLRNDMKEKINACIEIEDLENNIVEQLLFFLYSDSLGTLEWKNATQLYYAADKYQIEKLKTMCSSFLAENISISNASELLQLSDNHSDSNLIKVVEDFILKHEQVYYSHGWMELKKTNPHLVLKTMCLKYERKHQVN